MAWTRALVSDCRIALIFKRQSVYVCVPGCAPIDLHSSSSLAAISFADVQAPKQSNIAIQNE
jgi:hypothetical protein